MATTYSLHLLGGLSLVGATGPALGRVGQRRRLALLAVLAVERRRPVSRDKLLGLFWPEVGEERARHLLADSLYVLRAGLGEDAVTMLGDDVVLDEARIASDVGEFLDAIAAGDLTRAVALYAGPFLDGVHVSGAPEFDRWTDVVRHRLAAEHQGALERLAGEASERGDPAAAANWWRQVAAADPVSSRAVLGLMRALAQSGDAGAALRVARVHEQVLRNELDVAPDRAITALVDALRAPPASAVLPGVAAHPTIGETAMPPTEAPLDTSGMSQPVRRTPMPLLSVLEPREPSRARWTAWRRVHVGVVAASILALSLALSTILRRRDDRGDSAVPAPIRAVTRPAIGADMPSIAVLPFAAIGADSESAYLAEEVTDAVTRELGRLPTVRVVSRASALAARRLRLSAAATGDTLGARFVVEGTVGLTERELRVGVRLSDARAGTLLWSRVVDRRFTAAQVIGIEDSIARGITDALALGGVRNVLPRRVVRSPPSAEAYDAYLRGRYLWGSRNPAAVRRSVAAFELAIARDSTFAAAWAGLADGYVSLGIGNIGDLRPEDYFPRARRAAERALALDSSQVEAHATLGYIALLYDLDWDAAQRELARAITLGPSYTTAFIYHAILFEWTGHFEEALRETQYAQQLDPISPVSNIELGRALYLARRYDDAAAQLRATLDLDSMSLRAHMHLGQVYVQEHRYDDGIRELRRAATIAPSSRPIALLAHAYAVAGRRAEALALLDTLQRRRRRGYVPALDLAIVHAGLGDMDGTFTWLDSAFADHSIRPYLMDPTFDVLHADRRYRTLLARLHLPWPTK